MLLFLTDFFIFNFAFIMSLNFLFTEKVAQLSTLDSDAIDAKEQKDSPAIKFVRKFAFINKMVIPPFMRETIARNLSIAKIKLLPEEFFFLKEVAILLLVMFTKPAWYQAPNGTLILFIAIAGGFILPDFWLKLKVSKIKGEMIKALPDTIDLLNLCVSAGLDFMLALKWVVEKSRPSILIEEFKLMMREINLGRPRKDVLHDLAVRYSLPDLSSFSRTLVLADRMGTSVADALNILSEDMRVVRYRRAEQIALKAPLKLLVPLLIFIFPVVMIIVGGPILIQFTQTQPTLGF